MTQRERSLSASPSLAVTHVACAQLASRGRLRPAASGARQALRRVAAQASVLSCSGPARARAMAYFGEGRGPIHLDNVACAGSERALADCLKQEVGRHNCRHSEDAGVICDYSGKKAPGDGDKGKSLPAPAPPQP